MTAAVASATIGLLSNAAGTIRSVMDSRAKYLAFKRQAELHLKQKRRQSQEEQRVFGERTELRMAQYASDLGAVAVASGGGASLVDVSAYKKSVAYGVAMEQMSDTNAVRIRLEQIEQDMRDTRDKLKQAGKQNMINIATAVVGGAVQSGFDIGDLQGAVTAKREALKRSTSMIDVPQIPDLKLPEPEEGPYWQYNPRYSLTGGRR